MKGSVKDTQDRLTKTHEMTAEKPPTFSWAPEVQVVHRGKPPIRAVAGDPDGDLSQVVGNSRVSHLRREQHMKGFYLILTVSRLSRPPPGPPTHTCTRCVRLLRAMPK